MEILNSAKVDELMISSALRVSRQKHPLTTELLETISKMTVGQGFIVEKANWPFKTAPAGLARNYLQEAGSKVEVTGRLLMDKTGWLVARTK